MRAVRATHMNAGHGNACAQVIMPLINNWNDTSGVGEVLFWNGLSTHEDFFTDPGARRTYRNTVKAILTCVILYHESACICGEPLLLSGCRT